MPCIIIRIVSVNVWNIGFKFVRYCLSNLEISDVIPSVISNCIFVIIFLNFLDYCWVIRFDVHVCFWIGCIYDTHRCCRVCTLYIAYFVYYIVTIFQTTNLYCIIFTSFCNNYNIARHFVFYNLISQFFNKVTKLTVRTLYTLFRLRTFDLIVIQRLNVIDHFILCHFRSVFSKFFSDNCFQ